MLRVFVPIAIRPGEHIVLPTAQLAHVRARRLAAGDEITLFNGDGMDATALIAEAGKRECVVEITSTQQGLEYAECEVTLGLAVIAADRMDWALQKCAELGVTRIVPLLTERSQSAHVADRKREHWHGVLVSAAEQSGRSKIVELQTPMRVEQWLDARPAEQMLYCQLGATSVLSATARTASIAISIGPEGGWSTEEVDAFERQGACPVTLGRATLRAETAAVAAVSCIVCA